MLVFEGQPQANDVDHAWLIFDLIRDRVRGGVELRKGSRMTGLSCYV